MKYQIRTDPNKYRNSKEINLTIEAETEQEAKNKLRKEYNLNPFYFQFKQLKP
jgi:hypothetical protein